MQPRFNLIDVKPCFKAFHPLFRMLALPLVAMALLYPARASALVQTDSAQAGPPPSDGGFFPLNQVHRGQMATAWTVFTGTRPEPMQVEILGVLRGECSPDRGYDHELLVQETLLRATQLR